MRLLNRVYICLGVIALSACSTTGSQMPPSIETGYENPPKVEVPSIPAEPRPQPAPRQEDIPPPRGWSPSPPIEPLIERPLWFEGLEGWQTADHRPAREAFRRSCESWEKADPDALLNKNFPQYGRYRDWLPACAKLLVFDRQYQGNSQAAARAFFENEFAPLSLTTPRESEGLLTGYYEPEIEVRLRADREFSEPILAKPTNPETLSLPRSKINARSSRVIAYGRPIDVFFMQIQGSGRVKFKDGRSLRAAYAANNGKPYKSIGRVLVDRGEMTLSQASKQAIEAWMKKAGLKKTRALMNENPRYIYFAEQAIRPGEGPNGAMRVPLTAMGSIAVDPRYHPYGILAWLETTLPQSGGDYRGQPAGVLVSAQDTGSAIKGALRGDLFFGAGDEAGDKAGVMKHPVRWTLLVPRHLVPQPPVS